MSLKYSILFFVFFMSAFSLFPNEIDGIIGNGEYADVHTSDSMKFHSRLENSTLYIAVEAPTDGWVAAGFGSLRMDGAYIVMGYEKKDGPGVSQFEGSGHRLRKPDTILVSQWAVTESKESTIVEFSIPVENIKTKTVGDGLAVDMIMSYSKSDATWMKHSYYTSFTLPLR